MKNFHKSILIFLFVAGQHLFEGLATVHNEITNGTAPTKAKPHTCETNSTNPDEKCPFYQHCVKGSGCQWRVWAAMVTMVVNSLIVAGIIWFLRKMYYYCCKPSEESYGRYGYRPAGRRGGRGGKVHYIDPIE